MVRHPVGKVLFNVNVPGVVQVTENVDALPPGSLIEPPDAPSQVALLPIPFAHPMLLVMSWLVTSPTHTVRDGVGCGFTVTVVVAEFASQLFNCSTAQYVLAIIELVEFVKDTLSVVLVLETTT